MKFGSGTSAGRSSRSASSPAAKAWRKRTTPRKRVAGTPQSPKAVRPPLGQPLLVVLAHLRGLERGIVRDGRGGRDAGGLGGGGRLIARLRVVGEVAEHRARGLGEQVERGAEDAMLERGSSGRPSA